MLKRTAIIFLVFMLHVPGPLFSQQPAKPASVQTNRQLTFAEFDQEIQRLEAAVENLKTDPKSAAPLQASIPDKYIVVGNNTSFTINNTVLKKSIGEFTIAYPQRKDALLAATKSAVVQMHDGLSAYSHPDSYANEHKVLADVLSRREFRSVTGPTKLQIWSEKVKLWVERLLMKLFGSIPSPEHGSQLLTWILIGVATVLLALWLMRLNRGRDHEQVIERVLFAPSEKHWSAWLAEAKTAAAAGNWRDAVHLAYWAGISNLEESGAWVPDRARTPREYLRIIPARDPNRATLSALTKKFEVIWYGEFPAAASDFQETLRDLEALGCR